MNGFLLAPVKATDDSSTGLSDDEISDSQSERGSSSSESKEECASAPWDWWPDGTFKRDFTYEQFEEASELKVHWATRSWGGNKTGRTDAPTWKGGRLLRRKCQGILKCNNQNCHILVRPQSTDTRIKEQLAEDCACGGELRHIECPAHDSKWLWEKGVRYKHFGKHSHPAPTHLLHATKDEMKRFRELVVTNSSTKALGLIMGAPSLIPGVTEPRPSVRKISTVFSNSHRVAKERTKILKPYSTKGENDFLDAFSSFLEDNPDWMIHSHIQNGTMVFSFQSELMREQLIGQKSSSRPINGIVNDAAHGWWKNRSHLLMVSSTYNSKLKCWAPAVMSFTNGTTAEHFRHHFLALFISIATETRRQGIPISDKLFSGVSNNEYRG